MFDKLFITLRVLRGDFAARFDNDEGATAVEYGLLVALIAAIIVATVAALGIQIEEAFSTVVDALP